MMKPFTTILFVSLGMASCADPPHVRTIDAASSGGGAGGADLAGAGGDGSAQASSGASSTSDAGTAAAAGGSSADPNGCGPGDFVDAGADPVVVSDGVTYEPRCFEVVRGTTVRFVDDFAAHPLVGELVVEGEGMPDTTSPIAATSSGDEAAAELERAGEFGFFCDFHATLGMAGMIRVR